MFGFSLHETDCMKAMAVGHNTSTLPNWYAKSCTVITSTDVRFVFPFPPTVVGYLRMAENRKKR